MHKTSVFLAHGKEDARWVRSFYDLLDSVGAKPWMAPQDIPPGARWRDAVRQAITTADRAVACLSGTSVTRKGYVQRELRILLDLCQELPGDASFLIPLRLEPCEIPDLQIGSVNLRDLQWDDTFATGSFSRLLLAIGLTQDTSARVMLSICGNAASISEVVSGRLPDLHRTVARIIASSRVASTGTVHVSSRAMTFQSSSIGVLRELQLCTSVHATGVEKISRFTAMDGSEMSIIPDGTFLMGDPEMPNTIFVNQLPTSDIGSVRVPRFAISRCPVTTEQFAKFLSSSGYVIGQDFFAQEGKGDHPVTSVSWADASAYCQWASGRLPSEVEWEKAARGIDGRPYPWGSHKPHDRYCNFGNADGGTTPVRRYAEGMSPYGCFDMAGNVWEWCSTEVSNAEMKALESLGPEFASKGALYVVRGGSYAHEADACRSAGRFFGARDTRSPSWGFRLAMDLSAPNSVEGESEQL